MYIVPWGKVFFQTNKLTFLTPFFLNSTPVLIKIEKGCEYLTLCEPFDAYRA